MQAYYIFSSQHYIQYPLLAINGILDLPVWTKIVVVKTWLQ